MLTISVRHQTQLSEDKIAAVNAVMEAVRHQKLVDPTTLLEDAASLICYASSWLSEPGTPPLTGMKLAIQHDDQVIFSAIYDRYDRGSCSYGSRERGGVGAYWNDGTEAALRTLSNLGMNAECVKSVGLAIRLCLPLPCF